MEQKLQQISSFVVCDRLLPLAAKYPWLQEDGYQVGTDPLCYYPCQIPALMGRRIRGCFHGWVILSSHPDSVMWYLWNPVTLKTIHLPPLVLKDEDYESIGGDCCLPYPPEDTGSILLLNRTKQCTFVFCRLDRKRKNLRWTEMAYARQLKSITDRDGFLKSLTCFDGKVYALNNSLLYGCLIKVDIVVNDKEVVITLLPFVETPSDSIMSSNTCFYVGPFLKGGTELFFVIADVRSKAMRTLTDVHLFKLDISSMTWGRPGDLNNTIFFVDLAHSGWLFYRPTLSSELGGHIHIFGKVDKVISSYKFKDSTVFLSSIPCLVPKNYVQLWECRAEKEDKEDEIVPSVDKLVDISITRSSLLFNIPFDVLKIIMELCVGVEYLNFRATCRRCRLAAPVIRWSNIASLRRLHAYSLPSPWLIMFDTLRSVITFTDPMSGDKYFMKTPQELIGDVRIRCSLYGWLLVYNLSHFPHTVMLFNPFTNAIHMFPQHGYITSICFSAPPTSPYCMVAGLTAKRTVGAFIHIVNWGPDDWAGTYRDFDEAVPRSVSFPVLFLDSHVLHVLEAEGRLDVYRLREEGDRFWEVVAEAPSGCPSEAQCFLVKCDENRLLLVRVDEYGESVEVFKLSQTIQEWERIYGLGRRMIYICGATCLCVEAQTPEMENKIYFPRLHSKNGKIVFYSLETCRYHTFDGRKVEEESFGDFLGTKYILSPHAWIEPSWC